MTRWIIVTLFGCDFTCQLLIVGHGENNWHWNLFSMIIYIFSMIICTFPCQNNLIFIYLIIFTNIFDGIPFPPTSMRAGWLIGGSIRSCTIGFIVLSTNFVFIRFQIQMYVVTAVWSGWQSRKQLHGHLHEIVFLSSSKLF